jgi:nucleotidyltransferase substrate binding protein (TIGR01987 family)
MSDELHRTFEQLRRALDRLHEALDEPPTNRLMVDGTIQRFEFGIELYWKALKRSLAHEGIETNTPREALRRAYQAGWLVDEAAWLGMLQARNRAAHLYDEVMARAVVDDIRRWVPEMERVFALLSLRVVPGERPGE